MAQRDPPAARDAAGMGELLMKLDFMRAITRGENIWPTPTATITPR